MNMHSSRIHDATRFLSAISDQPETLSELMTRIDFKPWRLSAWMRRPQFRKRLAVSLKAMRRRRKLDLELSATAAIVLLGRVLAGGKGTLVQLEAARISFELYCKFYRPRTGSAKKDPRRATIGAVRSLIHPDVSPEEALGHIEALEGRAGAD